jgi:hypothetical protein
MGYMSYRLRMMVEDGSLGLSEDERLILREAAEMFEEPNQTEVAKSLDLKAVLAAVRELEPRELGAVMGVCLAHLADRDTSLVDFLRYLATRIESDPELRALLWMEEK